jgi:hypothetical protein
MPKYHRRESHRFIRAAAAVLLLMAATAVPFGAIARDRGAPSVKVGTGKIQDSGVHKFKPVKRAKSIAKTTRKVRPVKRAKSIDKTGIKPNAHANPTVREKKDDKPTKGGKCTAQQCQALKDKCIRDSGADEGKHSGRCIIRPGASGETCDISENARDQCNSISCEGAC